MPRLKLCESATINHRASIVLGGSWDLGFLKRLLRGLLKGFLKGLLKGILKGIYKWGVYGT